MSEKFVHLSLLCQKNNGMENKLQQLTEKLYNEGLSKGKQEGEEILSQAQQQAKAILDAANSDAAAIVAKAKADAVQLAATTKSEIQLASGQMISALRQQVASIVTASVFEPQIKAAYKDGSFVKQLIIKAVESFNPSNSDGVKVIVPEGFEAIVKDAVSDKLNSGVEVVTSGRVKVPFRIAPKDGSYAVSFSEADFDALFKSYIRSNVSDLLYK